MHRELVAIVVGALLVAGSATARADADPKTVRTWKAKCASCHGADGKGDTEQGKKMGVGDMTGAAFQKGLDDAAIAKAISDGIKREKDGKKQEMEAYKTKLAPDQVTALASYVRAFGPAGSAPVPAAKAPAATAKPADPAPAATKPDPAAAKPAVADAKTARTWKSSCASCHGHDGKGSVQGRKLGAPDFSSTAWQKATDDATLAAFLAKNEVKDKSGKVGKHVKAAPAPAAVDALVRFVRTLAK